MGVIDTNVLLYASFRGFREHAKARAVLQEIQSGAVQHHLTWVNVFEYLRTATHPRMLRPAPLTLEAALENVRSLLEQDRVSRIDPRAKHLEVFAEVCREAGRVAGNFVHDCRIAAIMRENGVRRIVTHDTSFRRIPGLEVVDPFGDVDPFGEEE